MATEHAAYQNGKDAEAGASEPNLKGGADLSRTISVTLTPSQFEEMYFQPSMKVRI